MPCYHPLKAFYTRGLDGKLQLRFLSKFYDENGKVDSFGFGQSPDLARLLSVADVSINKDIVSIPCGRCVGCRLDYSAAWALRCQLESSFCKEDECWFFTLTYDDEHIPVNSRDFSIDPSTGEFLEGVQQLSYTLNSSDLQLFNKRLREYFSREYNVKNIRFFASGEYGSKTFRPHYHVIYFNLPIPDLVQYRYGPYSTMKDGRKYQLFESDIISKLWGKGLVCIGRCNFHTCAYTARYVMKKQKGENADSFYNALNVEPEFSRCSRMPGIGFNYYEKHKDKIYQTDEVLAVDSNGLARSFSPPKYFDRLYQKENPIEYMRIQERRLENGYYRNIQRLSLTDLDEYAYLEVCENAFKEKAKALIRPL